MSSLVGNSHKHRFPVKTTECLGSTSTQKNKQPNPKHSVTRFSQDSRLSKAK